MKVPKNINQKLKRVEIRNRVFIYDATIIIEFLNKTFMPLNYNIKNEIIPNIGAGFEIEKDHLKDPDRFDELFSKYRLSEIYDFYKMFRQQVDYTAPVETAFKFNMIVRKLIFSKNGWQFKVRRVGRAQLWYMGPLELRSKVPAELKSEYPVPKNEVQVVGLTPDDMNDIEEEDEENFEAKEFMKDCSAKIIVGFPLEEVSNCGAPGAPVAEEVIVDKIVDEEELFPEEHILIGGSLPTGYANQIEKVREEVIGLVEEGKIRGIEEPYNPGPTGPGVDPTLM